MSEEQKVKLIYDGKDGQLYKIWLVNLLLKICTLGVYNFWGKTRLRRYITNSFLLLSDRFEYSGTGGELFRGFLKALPIIIIMYLPFIIFKDGKNPAVNLMFFPIFFLIFAATYTSIRYRYSRTTWRGIRGHLTGSALKYASLRMFRTILNIITLGILIPYSDISIQKYQIDHTHFGTAKAEFNGNGSKLMGVHIIPVYGTGRLWYGIFMHRPQLILLVLREARLAAICLD